MPKFPFQHHGNRGGAIAVLLALLAPAAFALPTISQQPLSAVGAAGAALTVSVAATGSGPLSYQWRRNGYALAGATASTLTLARPSQADSGPYDVLINDGQGTIASAAADIRIGPAVYPDRVTPELDTAVLLEQSRSGQLTWTEPAPDGSFYVCGTFSSIGGVRRDGFARFKPDGTLDLSFAPSVSEGRISALAVQADGRLLVVGSFRALNGISAICLARLHADGSLDTSFQAGASFAAGPGAAPQIALAPNGDFYISGNFTAYQDHATSHVVRIRPNGEVDRSFAASILSAAPSRIAPTPDGKLYCGNAPYQQAGQTRNNGVCRLLPNGSLDPSFDAGSGPLGTVATIGPIFRQRDGRVLVSGRFTSYSGHSARSALVRLNEDGSVDPSFTPERVVGSNTMHMAQAADGDLLFSSGSNPLIRLKLDGSLNRDFAAGEGGGSGPLCVTAMDRIVKINDAIAGGGDIALYDRNGARLNARPNPRFPASASLIERLPGDKFLVGGSFSTWNGVAVPCLVRVNADLTLDPTFRASITSDYSVSRGTRQPDGKILVITPNVDNVSGSWLRRLNPDGSNDPTFRSTDVLPTGAIAVLADGRIVTASASESARPHVVTADGTPVNTHEFVSAGIGSTVRTTIAQLPNRQYLVAGGFSSWAGLPHRKLVRLQADGSLDPSFTLGAAELIPSGFDTANVATQRNGRILYQAYRQGDSLRQYLIGVRADGQPDPTFSPALPEAGGFFSYTIQADDRLLTWGIATLYQPMRLLADGARDPSFEIVGAPLAIAPGNLSWHLALTLDDGDIVAAVSGRLLRFARVTAPRITTQPAAVARVSGESATFSVAATGGGPFTYQWYHNGEALAGATNATLSLSRVHSLQTGLYSVAVTNASGTARSTDALLTIDRSASATSRLSNLSVRARSAGATPISTGFTVGGGGKELLIRGIGPGLAQFGTPGVAVDPRLAIFVNNAQIDQNDNWGGTTALTNAFNAVGAFGLPAGSLDAAVVRSVAGGASAQLRSTGEGGVTLTEIYDTAPLGSSGARLTNVSVLSRVGTGADILIAGFNIVGPGSKELLIRGVGPGLAGFGVADRLVDPQLAVYSGVDRIAENGDWGGTVLIANAASSVGAFPLAANSKDAALVVSLPAGSYSVQLSGVGGTTGEGLIEVYELP